MRERIEKAGLFKQRKQRVRRMLIADPQKKSVKSGVALRRRADGQLLLRTLFSVALRMLTAAEGTARLRGALTAVG